MRIRTDYTLTLVITLLCGIIFNVKAQVYDDMGREIISEQKIDSCNCVEGDLLITKEATFRNKPSKKGKVVYQFKDPNYLDLNVITNEKTNGFIKVASSLFNEAWVLDTEVFYKPNPVVNFANFADMRSLNQNLTILEYSKERTDCSYNKKDHAMVLHFIAYATYEAKQYRKSIVLFDQAIALHPMQSSYYYRGLAKTNLKQYRMAISDLKRSSKQTDSIQNILVVLETPVLRDYTLLNIGLSYYYLKDYKMAIKYLSKTINLNPNMAIAYYYRGGCYAQIDKQLEACKDFVEAGNLGHKDSQDIFRQKCIKK